MLYKVEITDELYLYLNDEGYKQFMAYVNKLLQEYNIDTSAEHSEKNEDIVRPIENK